MNSVLVSFTSETKELAPLKNSGLTSTFFFLRHVSISPNVYYIICLWAVSAGRHAHDHIWRSWGSSVSIVSDYTLDDRATAVRSPVAAKDFSSSLCVQTSSEAHPASCLMGTGDPFPGSKAWPGSYADYSPHLVPRSIMSRSYAIPPCRLHGCSGTALIYLRPHLKRFWYTHAGSYPEVTFFFCLRVGGKVFGLWRGQLISSQEV
jgi:hypothetical protein